MIPLTGEMSSETRQKGDVFGENPRPPVDFQQCKFDAQTHFFSSDEGRLPHSVREMSRSDRGNRRRQRVAFALRQKPEKKKKTAQYGAISPPVIFFKNDSPLVRGGKSMGRARAELDFCPVWGGGRFVKRPYEVCSSSLLFTNFAGGCGQPPLRVGSSNLLCGKFTVREDLKKICTKETYDLDTPRVRFERFGKILCKVDLRIATRYARREQAPALRVCKTNLLCGKSAGGRGRPPLHGMLIKLTLLKIHRRAQRPAPTEL